MCFNTPLNFRSAISTSVRNFYPLFLALQNNVRLSTYASETGNIFDKYARPMFVIFIDVFQSPGRTVAGTSIIMRYGDAQSLFAFSPSIYSIRACPQRSSSRSSDTKRQTGTEAKTVFRSSLPRIDRKHRKSLNYRILASTHKDFSLLLRKNRRKHFRPVF